jgi:hypothetical protein
MACSVFGEETTLESEGEGDVSSMNGSVREMGQRKAFLMDTTGSRSRVKSCSTESFLHQA